MKHFYLPLALLMFLITGCTIWQQPPPPATTPPATITGQPVAQRAPETSTPTPAPTVTPAAITTLTTVPTLTATATSTPTPSLEPTPDLPATVMATTAAETIETLLSPDGRQRAAVIVYPCVEIRERPGDEALFEYAYEQLKIFDVAQGTEKIVAHQLRYCGGLGASGLDLLFWSPEGRYLYYTTAREGRPDGCAFWWQPAFRRIDPVTGNSQQLGAGALSPDHSKIAAWDSTDQQLVLWETDGGEVARLPGPSSTVAMGPIAWSPDSQALVYLQGDGYGFCVPETTDLMHAPLASSETSLLLEAQEPPIAEVSWIDSGRLKLVNVEGGQQIVPVPNAGPSPHE